MTGLKLEKPRRRQEGEEMRLRKKGKMEKGKEKEKCPPRGAGGENGPGRDL